MAARWSRRPTTSRTTPSRSVRSCRKGGRTRCSGTDGFGRSDFRTKLREFFEVDRHYIVVAALKALAEEGSVPPTKVAEAIARYGIDAEQDQSALRLSSCRKDEQEWPQSK